MKIRWCLMLMLCASCGWSQAADSPRPSSGKPPSLEISRAGTRTSMPGSSANFTGSVRQERVFTSVVPSGAVGGSVTFSPGSRTLWHTHPRGQVLIITEGTGLVQIEGGPIETVHAGDVIKIPANTPLARCHTDRIHDAPFHH